MKQSNYALELAGVVFALRTLGFIKQVEEVSYFPLKNPNEKRLVVKTDSVEDELVRIEKTRAFMKEAFPNVKCTGIVNPQGLNGMYVEFDFVFQND